MSLNIIREISASQNVRNRMNSSNDHHHETIVSVSNGGGISSIAKQRKVLMVEDNPVIQRIHLEYLRLAECHITVAKNGREALKWYRNGYDLILLDIGLPDIDGLTVANTIRSEFTKQELPIVAVTAHGIGIESQCLDAGFNDILHKPVECNHLMSSVSRWLKIKNVAEKQI